MMCEITEDFISAVQRKYGYDLAEIGLSRNNLKSIFRIEKLSSNLLVLDLSFNCIQDLSPLSVLFNVEELNLRQNLIMDVTPLKHLTRLTVLDLSENKLSTTDAFSSLNGLSLLEKLNVHGNPLCWSSVDNSSGFAHLHVLFSIFSSLKWIDDCYDRNDVLKEGNNENQIVNHVSSSSEAHTSTNKVRSMELQVAAMERILKEQERVIAESASTDVTYHSLLQHWREETFSNIKCRMGLQNELDASISAHRKLRDDSKSDNLVQEAKNATMKEKLIVLEEQISQHHHQLVQCQRTNDLLEADKLDLSKRHNTLSVAFQQIRTFMEQFQHRVREDVMVQQAAMAQVTEKVDVLQRRLQSAQGHVETAHMYMMHKEILHRNTIAAVESDRLLWLESQSSLGKTAERDGGESSSVSPALSQLSICPEVEALLRSFFRQLDQEDTGLVSCRDLLLCLQMVPSVRSILAQQSTPFDWHLYEASSQHDNIPSLLCVIEHWLKGKLSITNELNESNDSSDAQLSDAEGSDCEVTWGEFLLCLMPQSNSSPAPQPLSVPELEALRKSNLILSEFDGGALLSLHPLLRPGQYDDVKGSMHRGSGDVVPCHPRQVVQSDEHEIRRLSYERAFLMKRVQELSLSVVHRAECIKGYFQHELTKRDLQHQHLDAQLTSVSSSNKELQYRLDTVMASAADDKARLQEALNDMRMKNEALEKTMDVWRGEEGEKYESLLSNERSRGIKFEIELKCLRKETGKLDIQCKALQRDALRYQTQAAADAADLQKYRSLSEQQTITREEEVRANEEKVRTLIEERDAALKQVENLEIRMSTLADPLNPGASNQRFSSSEDEHSMNNSECDSDRDDAEEGMDEPVPLLNSSSDRDAYSTMKRAPSYPSSGLDMNVSSTDSHRRGVLEESADGSLVRVVARSQQKGAATKREVFVAESSAGNSRPEPPAIRQTNQYVPELSGLSSLRNEEADKYALAAQHLDRLSRIVDSLISPK